MMLARIAFVVWSAAVWLACSSSRAVPDNPAVTGLLGTEKVKGGSVEKADVNGDGKADVWKYVKDEPDPSNPGQTAQKLWKKEVDLNFDGKVDITTEYDAAGKIDRQMTDQDFDGKVDLVEIFAEGQVTEQQMDTGFDGKLDVWRLFDGGSKTPTLIKRDLAPYDGKVDVWESYQDGRLVRTGRDLDGDGKPETYKEAGEQGQ